MVTQDLNVTSIRTVTPTMLSTFERCPHQFHLRYVEKTTSPQSFSPDLACANAAHAVLHGVFDVYRRTGGYPINLRERVEDALPSAPYLDGAFWAMDVERVLGWVKWALGSIDETARVVLVERWLEYAFPGNEDWSPFRLRHRIDIVFEHADGTLEHRDWKSGKRAEVDALQTVAARILVRQAFPDHQRILSSTGFLALRLMQIDELTREQVSTEWQRMKRLTTQITKERDWHPVSNPLCPWCPFYQRGCSLYGASDGKPDGTTAWLEGAA
jgi:hypothetical protein